MNVGIASCYYHRNYGSMLQAYATQRIIERLGHTAVTIQCQSPITYMTQSKASYYFHKVTNRDIVKTKIRQYKSRRRLKKHSDIIRNIDERNKCFDGFAGKYFKLSPENKNRQDLEKLSASFDAVVVGSDMLWHPINVEHDYYTLTFVPDNVKKIAYATSFGTTLIPKYQREIYKTFLNRFQAISVREKSGIDVLESLEINKPGTVVLDPTLLFTGTEWMEIQNEQPFVDEKYIFCYFLGVNREHRQFAEKIRELTGYKIVALQHLDEFVEEDIGYADETLYNVGPSEFVNLIRNARFVCTDSFHGTCFSILNHKKFFTFNRFKAGNTQSTNTRLDSLLSMLGLEDRRISPEDIQKDISDKLSAEIAYEPVEALLAEKRADSVQYLDNALKGR